MGPHNLVGDRDRFQFLGAELSHAGRESAFADEEIQERDTCRLMQLGRALRDVVGDALQLPRLQDVGAVLGQLPGRAGAHRLHNRAAGQVRRLCHVVLGPLIPVSGISEHGTEGPAQLDGAQIHRRAVLAAEDVHQVLNDGHANRSG